MTGFTAQSMSSGNNRCFFNIGVFGILAASNYKQLKVLRKSSILLILALGLLVPGVAIARLPGDAIDMKRIPQRSVRKLVRSQQVKTAADFQAIATSCYRTEDSSRYQTNLKTYVVKAGIGQVWEQYISITPQKAWSGKTIGFGFLFSKEENEFFYAENENDPIRLGDIIYVNLRLLKGLKNLGVGFEVVALDEVNKVITFCYLKDGASNGSQEISFSAMADGCTRISHLTHYRSRSVFRDKRLYPYFHEKFVGEFHANVLRQIQNEL